VASTATSLVPSAAAVSRPRTTTSSSWPQTPRVTGTARHATRVPSLCSNARRERSVIDESVIEVGIRRGVAHRRGLRRGVRRGPAGSAARLDDGRVEDLASGRERGAGIRVVVGETTGFAHTSDLSEPGCGPRPSRGRGGAPRGRRRAHRRPEPGVGAAAQRRARSCPRPSPRPRRWRCCGGPTKRLAPRGGHPAGDRGLRGQPAPDPGRQQRRGSGDYRRPGQDPFLGLVRRQRRHRDADRAGVRGRDRRLRAVRPGATVEELARAAASRA
jgi:hypothetical protein